MSRNAARTTPTEPCGRAPQAGCAATRAACRTRAWPALRYRAVTLAATLLAAATAVPAIATELPWLPPRASATLKLEASQAAADAFLVAGTSAELTHGTLDTEVRSIRVTYGLGDSWAIDGGTGTVDASAPALDQVAGGSGPEVGLIWRPVNEQVTPGAPSVALRVGWMGAGDYPADLVHAPGPASGGYAISAAVGKVFREALSFSASFGGRLYAEPVPAVLSARVSAALLSQPQTLQRILGGMEGGMIFRASYRRDFSTGDLDVADPYLPDLDDDRFPELAREFTRASLGVAVAAGPMEIAAEGFRYLGGRNVAELNGVTVGVTLKADLLTLLGLL